MTHKKLTKEQVAVVEYMESPENTGILLVSAVAGSGKSYLSRVVVDTLKPRSALYTAFNKAIVEEGIDRFEGTEVECKTLHALAYRYVQPKAGIEALAYTCITEDLTYPQKASIIEGIDKFFVSASTDMAEFFNTIFEEDLADIAESYVQKMIDEKIKPSFGFLLKYFHLMLVEDNSICEYDLVILDEINDTTAVALEIFKSIKAPKKLGLGEPTQAIYQFLNLVDGFSTLEGAKVLPLTGTFRCNNEIASRVEEFMREKVKGDFKFTSLAEGADDGKEAYITATNAAIIENIIERLDEGKGFTLLRNISQIFALSLAITSASMGKSVYQKQYKHLENEYKKYKQSEAKYSFQQHLVATIQDQETKTAVALLQSMRRNNQNIFDIYKRAKKAKVDPKYTCASVFTSKGMEYSKVTIANDLNNKVAQVIQAGGIQNEEDLTTMKCYYVACSRAKTTLENAVYLN